MKHEIEKGRQVKSNPFLLILFMLMKEETTGKRFTTLWNLNCAIYNSI